MSVSQATRGETGKDSHGWGLEGSLAMESFQTPFIGCLKTGALQEQDEPAPLEHLGALQRNPDAETEQDPITTLPTLCSHPSPPPVFINLRFDFVNRHDSLQLSLFSYMLFLFKIIPVTTLNISLY